jgi:hypothetical protein
MWNLFQPCISTSKTKPMKTNTYHSARFHQLNGNSFMPMQVIAFLLFMLFTSAAFAQSNKVVKGVVTMADDGSALGGSHIQLKGTAIGTVTDAAGKFEFPQALKPNDILVFSFIGLKTQEYTITETTPDVLSIVMEFEEISMVGELSDCGLYEPKQNVIARIRTKLKGIF